MDPTQQFYTRQEINSGFDLGIIRNNEEKDKT